MTGLMTITLPAHADSSKAEIQPIPLISIQSSLNITLRRGSTNKLNNTLVKTFKVTKCEGKTLSIQVNFTDPISISTLSDSLDIIEVLFKRDPSDLLNIFPLVYQASSF